MALIGIYFAWEQLYQSKLIAKGTLMLKLEELSDLPSRTATHAKLRPSGQWGRNKGGPSGNEEWAEVDDYMGFFEHCELLLRAGSIQLSEFELLFGYRVTNLIRNDIIYKAKLIETKEDWKLFVALHARLNRYDPEKYPRGTAERINKLRALF